MTLDTAGAGNQPGNITFNAAISAGGAANAALTANADGAISVNADILIGNKDLTMLAGRGGSAGGIFINKTLQTGNGQDGHTAALRTMKGDIVFNLAGANDVGIITRGNTRNRDGSVVLRADEGAIVNNSVATALLTQHTRTLDITAAQGLQGNAFRSQDLQNVGVSATNGSVSLASTGATPTLNVNASSAPNGSLSFTAGPNSSITIAGAVSAGTAASFAAERIAVDAPVTVSGGAISLSTTGAACFCASITQNTSGVLAGDTLTIASSGNSSNANVLLDGTTNAITNRGATTLPRGFMALRDAGGLVVTGPLTGGGFVLETSGPLAVNNTIDNPTGLVALRTSGGSASTITQTAPINAGTLALRTANANVTLNNASNAISNLDQVELGSGALRLTNGSERRLNISNDWVAGSIVLNNPNGTISSGGAVHLDTSATNGPITLVGRSIGDDSGGAVRVIPGTGTVTATSTTGGAFVAQDTGDAQFSRYVFNVPPGQALGLATRAGNIVVDVPLHYPTRNISLVTFTASSLPRASIGFANGVTVDAAGLTINTPFFTNTTPTVSFANANVTFNTPVTLGGGVTMAVSGTSDISVNAPMTLRGPSLIWSNGTLRGTGLVTVLGTTNVTGGTPQLLTTLSTDVLTQTGGTLTVNRGAVLNLTGVDRSTIVSGTLVNHGVLNLQVGTFQANTGFPVNNGTFILGAGTAFSTTANLTNAPGGVIGGNGTLNLNGNTLVNNGTLAPGASPGVFEVVGNFTQGPLGVVDLELAGPTPGTGYDALRITGVATLAGTLNATNVRPFAISPGDVFDVMSFGNRSGDFTTFSLPPGVQAAATSNVYRLFVPAALPPNTINNHNEIAAELDRSGCLPPSGPSPRSLQPACVNDRYRPR